MMSCVFRRNDAEAQRNAEGLGSPLQWIQELVELVDAFVTKLFSSSRFSASLRLCVVFLLFASGCSEQGNDSRQEVIFWHFWGGKDRPVVEEIVARFNAQSPDYRVRAVAMPGNNLDLKFFLSVAGGDPPDLLNQDDPVVADWAHRGVIVPLAELATSEEVAELSQWLYPSARALASYNDRLFALPNGLDIRALYVNRTLLAEYDIEPPTTIAELDFLAETIAPPNASGPLARVGYLPDPRRLWAWGTVFGGEFYDPSALSVDARITCDDPNVVVALTWMASYRDRYGASRVAAFRSGDQSLSGAAFPLLQDRRYAAIMDGQWRVRDIEQYAASRAADGRVADEFGVVPLPKPPEGRENAGWVNGNFFIVPRGAKCPDGAWEFAKFWAGFGGYEGEAARACAAGGWIPVSARVAERAEFQDYLAAHPLMQPFVELAKSPEQRPIPPLPVASLYDREMRDAGQDVMYRGADPQTRLELAARRIRDRLRAVEANAANRESQQ